MTLNESANISTCIKSLQFCDHIFVLDSGSSDQTVPISEKLGAHVFVNSQTPPFDISLQRNFALDYIHSFFSEPVWILFLDADETSNPAFENEVLKAISSSSFTSYQCCPMYLFYGDWIKQFQSYPVWHDRLLLLGTNSFLGGVWEHFKSYDDCGYIKSPYYHNAMSKGLDDWLVKHIRYADWDAQATYAFLTSNTSSSFATERNKHFRNISHVLWPLRPFIRFFVRYVLRLGFLKGKNIFIFAFCMFLFDLVYVLKVIFLLSRFSSHD